MATLRRFTQSPRYRALWRTPGTNLFVSGFVGLLIYSLVENTQSQWVRPLLIGYATGTIFQFIDRWLNNSKHKHDDVGPVFCKNVEDRLDELERLKRRDMVTPEEYAAKRQEILKDL